MHIFSQSLGNLVKQKRECLGLTQNELAEQVEVAPRTILNIENYKGNPKLEVLYRLIQTLEIDPHELFFPKVHQPTTKMTQLQILIADCNDDEIDFLLPVCESVISVLRAQKRKKIR